MTIQQASVTPITNHQTLETITLKNLITLDLVQQNEALLKACQLLDDSQLKVSLGDKITVEQLKELIDERKQEDLSEELKQYKYELQQYKDKDTELVNRLAREFLEDGAPLDDTDDLIAQYGKENGVKVVFDYDDKSYNSVSLTIQE
jgi:hypothetical protein